VSIKRLIPDTPAAGSIVYETARSGDRATIVRVGHDACEQGMTIGAE
jgi:hypothetical protein